MKVTIYTDGCCEPNPGPGTWAFICTSPYHEQCGHDENTTNNRMEIMAVIQAVEYAQQLSATEIEVFSDSQYVVKGFNFWSHPWKANNWTKLQDDQWVPVKNADLWKRLDKYRGKLKLKWIKGHDGNEYNEQADLLATEHYRNTFAVK